MERLDKYFPETAEDETRILELILEPTESPRQIALVESFPQQTDEATDVAVVEAFDLEERETLSVVEVELEASNGEAVRRHPTGPRGLQAELLGAVVEGLLADTDYGERLRDHAGRFRDADKQFHEADVMPPEAFEGVGRNDPCPCESGRKYKQCCLRRDRTEELPARYDLDVDDFLQAWRTRADDPEQVDRLEGVNQVMEALWAILAVGGNAEKLSVRLLEDVGLSVDGPALEEAAAEARSVTDFPDHWREEFREEWTWQAPLLEVVLPLVAEILWEARVPEQPRPHRIKSCIQGGYDSDESADRIWQRWYRAWRQLEDWVEARDIADDALVDRLDEALALWEGVEQWVVDLLELARQRADEDTPYPGEATEEALEVFEGVGEVFSRAAPELANDADVFRYAALLDIGEYDRARRVLDGLEAKPIADRHAALYLGDLFLEWNFEAPDDHLEQVGVLADRTIEELDERELEEVRDVRDELEELRNR